MLTQDAEKAVTESRVDLSLISRDHAFRTLRCGAEYEQVVDKILWKLYSHNQEIYSDTIEVISVPGSFNPRSSEEIIEEVRGKFSTEIYLSRARTALLFIANYWINNQYENCHLYEGDSEYTYTKGESSYDNYVSKVLKFEK